MSVVSIKLFMVCMKDGNNTSETVEVFLYDLQRTLMCLKVRCFESQA